MTNLRVRANDEFGQRTSAKLSHAQSLCLRRQSRLQNRQYLRFRKLRGQLL